MKETSQHIWVFTYTIIYFFLTIFYCLPRILAEYSTLDVSHITENFSFPLEIFAWGLLAITAAYAGLDRATFMKKSSLMDFGEYDIGNTTNLKTVIILLILICGESYILNFYLGHSITIYGEHGPQTFSGIALPLEGITTALVSTVTIYVAGNKAIKGNQYTTGEKKV
jgi:hypothetical protein